MTGASAVRTRSDRTRVVVAVAAVVAAVTVPTWFDRAAILAALGVALITGRTSMRRWLKRAGVASAFLVVLSLLVPFTGGGQDVFAVWRGAGWIVTQTGLERWTVVLSRGLLAVGWLAWLGTSMAPERLANALVALRVPPRMVSIAWLTYRYLAVLRDELHSLLRAWSVRRVVPRRHQDFRALAGIVGVLFVRSYERAERVHAAMLARGYDANRPLTSGGRT